MTVEQDSRDDEILTPASTLRPQDLIFTILGTYVLPALARAGAARRRPAVPRRPPLPQPQPDRLYLCGSSTHPGGNVTGMPGYIAASELAKDLGVTPWWRPFDIWRDMRSAVGSDPAYRCRHNASPLGRRSAIG